jgi:hypothetical protein
VRFIFIRVVEVSGCVGTSMVFWFMVCFMPFLLSRISRFEKFYILSNAYRQFKMQILEAECTIVSKLADGFCNSLFNVEFAPCLMLETYAIGFWYRTRRLVSVV